jgi:hypothetical protein
MTFIFEDGTHLGIEASVSHDFIRHDLDWTVEAHGKLVDISYTHASTDKIGFISDKVKSVLDLPIRKCSRLLRSVSGLLGGRHAPARLTKCSGR